MEIIKDNMLTIPLYHGTSSLFLDSICNKGLNGINSIKKYDVIAFINDVYMFAEEVFRNDQDWIFEKITLKPMINQEVTSGGFNFRHGTTYVSPCKETAIRYALSNRYGSEILSEAIRIYKKINVINSDIERKYSEIIEISQNKYKPILIKVNQVNYRGLKSESGESPEKIVELIEYLLKNKQFAMLQQKNFELNEVVESKQLEIYEIIGDSSRYELKQI